MYYVYMYSDPETNLPFYIGKGQGNRMLGHLKETLVNTENRQKYYKIESLRSRGLSPIISILVDNIEDETLAYELEDMYILMYGRRNIDPNGILTNVCINARPPHKPGQLNGMYNKTHTDEAKAAISTANKGKRTWNKGIPRNDEVKNAISRANKGSTAWNNGVPRTEAERALMRFTWNEKIKRGYVSPLKGISIPKTHTCEYCNLLLTKSNYTRWHGKKCKENK